MWWKHHQSGGGDPQNPPMDLGMFRSLVIHLTACARRLLFFLDVCIVTQIASTADRKDRETAQKGARVKEQGVDPP